MTDHGRLAGKKALITGGAGGIGSAMGHAFARHGAQVMISDLAGDRAAEAAAAINATVPGSATSCAHDVTSEEDWKTALRRTEAAFGGLNVLVNNAGTFVIASVEDTEPGDWRRTLDVNLDSVYLGIRLAMPLLRVSQPASIINISSVAGLVAGHNIAAYNVSKAGVWMLTKSTALHAARRGDDIRANSIHPTFIETAMLEGVAVRCGVAKPLDDGQRDKFAGQIPLGRLCTVEDVAFAAIYLASDGSRFMTGAEMKLDGGLSAM